MRAFPVCQSNAQSLLSGILRLLAVVFVFQGVCHALVVPASRAEIDSSSIKNPLLDGRDGATKRMATVPSVRFIRDKIKAGGRMNNKVSIFWSRFYPQRDGWKAAKDWGFQIFSCDRAALYNHALPPDDWSYFQSVNEEDPITWLQNTQKLQVMSAAFAQTSSGNVDVLVDDGKDLRSGPSWTNYELPNLTAPGSAVTEIFLVRWPSLTQQSIWKRGNPQQGVWPPNGADPSIFAG